jgi:NADPH:quinone reductase-like Zn-dependent oxidoreductase
MKAIRQINSGPPEVLKLVDARKPIPADDEVLIRVHAATVTRGDVILRKLHPLLYLPMSLFGIKRKEITGHEFAGVVDETGKEVEQFKPGDQVFGTTTGLKVGANAEYVCVPEKWSKGVLGEMPENAAFDEAAALPIGGMTALDILKKGNIQPGHKVLIYGASGSVGTYAVQLAKHYYGAEVTGVCSTTNIDLTYSLGADYVIDYSQENFKNIGQTYDVIFDAVGKISKSNVKDMLSENGIYLTVQSTTKETLADLLILKDLFEKKKIKPVIDQRFSLEQTAEAHRYVETGRKKGNVVITVISHENGGTR